MNENERIQRTQLDDAMASRINELGRQAAKRDGFGRRLHRGIARVAGGITYSYHRALRVTGGVDRDYIIRDEVRAAAKRASDETIAQHALHHRLQEAAREGRLADEAFRIMDVPGNGGITLPELCAAMKTAGIASKHIKEVERAVETELERKRVLDPDSPQPQTGQRRPPFVETDTPTEGNARAYATQP